MFVSNPRAGWTGLSLLVDAGPEADRRRAGEGEGLLLWKAERHRAPLPGQRKPNYQQNLRCTLRYWGKDSTLTPRHQYGRPLHFYAVYLNTVVACTGQMDECVHVIVLINVVSLHSVPIQWKSYSDINIQRNQIMQIIWERDAEFFRFVKLS